MLWFSWFFVMHVFTRFVLQWSCRYLSWTCSCSSYYPDAICLSTLKLRFSCVCTFTWYFDYVCIVIYSFPQICTITKNLPIPIPSRKYYWMVVEYVGSDKLNFLKYDVLLSYRRVGIIPLSISSYQPSIPHFNKICIFYYVYIIYLIYGHCPWSEYIYTTEIYVSITPW